MPSIGDLKLAVSGALTNVYDAVQGAIALRQGQSAPPSPAAVTAALNKISAAAAALSAAVAALNSAGVATSVEDAQTVAINAAIQSGLDLWGNTIQQLRQAGVTGI